MDRRKSFVSPFPRTSFLHFTLTLLLVSFSRFTSTAENSYGKFTEQVFASADGKTVVPEGYPAAFWDTNHDRITDVIMWKDDTVSVYQSKSGIQQKHPTLVRRSVIDLFILVFVNYAHSTLGRKISGYFVFVP